MVLHREHDDLGKMEGVPLSPRVDDSLPPPMHEMDEYKFQRLAMQLLYYEPNIATSDEYGTRGQGDRGADVIGRRAQYAGQELVSCKCYEKATAPLIAEWSGEFLKHWDDHWKNETVRRFILFTAATNAADRKIQDQVNLERKRFEEIGVEYELWGPAMIAAKARPDRAICNTYFGKDWAEILCGPAGALGLRTGARADMLSSGVVGQIADLQQRLSAQSFALAEQALDDLRCGRLPAVRAFLVGQREPSQWTQLGKPAQAKILRLEASLALQEDDAARAEALRVEAEAIEPADEPRLAAHIAFESEGPARALDILGEVSSVAGLQYKTALHVMVGEVAAANESLARLLLVDQADPETIRMQALVALAANRRGEALNHIRRAEAAAPEWRAVKQMGAIVRYAQALSPILDPDWYLSPNAFDGSFVRDDLASQAMLADAVARFDALVNAEPDTLMHRLWRFAALVSLRDQRDRAQVEAADLLVRADHHPTVIAWCLFRGIDVDLAPSEKALRDAYAEGADETQVRVLGLLFARGTLRGAEVFEAGLAKQSGAARREAEAWITRLSPSSDGLNDGTAEASLLKAKESGDWSDFEARLSSLLSPSSPDPAGLPLAEVAASEGQFELVAAHVDALALYDTAAAIRLGAHSLARTGAHSRLLAYLEDHAAVFGESLPPDVRRLQIEARAQSGDMQGALREAERLAALGSLKDRLFHAELLTSVGNIRAAIPVVEEALGTGLLDGNRAYQWSQLIRVEAPRLARKLVEHAVETEVDDRLLLALMNDASDLSPTPGLEALAKRVRARAESDAPDVRLLTIEDIPAIVAAQKENAETGARQFSDGLVPSQLYHAHRPGEFASLYLGGRLAAGEMLSPWLIRHGARPEAVLYDRSWHELHLHLDVSALLTAARLDLLDVLEAQGNPVAIALDLPIALLAMENELREKSDDEIAARVAAAPLVPMAHVGDAAMICTGDPVVPGGLAFVSFVALLAERRLVSPETATVLVAGLDPHSSEEEGEQDEPRELSDDAWLFLDAGAAYRLAAQDVLGTLALQFRMGCAPQLLDQARQVAAAASDARRHADMLAVLRTRLADGIAAGRYVMVPRATDEDGELDVASSPLARSFGDLISATGKDGAVAWIDDRMTTGYGRAAHMVIAGTPDILASMAAAGVIDDVRRVACIRDLRAAGAMFLVPDTDEIIAELLRAPTREQELIETPALAVLRQSLALAALMERHLAIGTTEPALQGQPDEYLPAQTAMHILGQGVKAIWSNVDLDFDRQVACSDWLWANARRTHVDREIPGNAPAEAQHLFEVIQVGQGIDYGFDIGGLFDRRRAQRLDYQRWFWMRAVEPLLAVDPDFLGRLTSYLADLYLSLERPRRRYTPGRMAQVRALVARRIYALPQVLQNELFRDPRLASYGKTQEVVRIGRYMLHPDPFWRAVREAMRFGVGRVRARGLNGRWRQVRLRRDGDAVVLTGAVRARIGEHILDVVWRRGADRDAAVERFLGHLRLPSSEAERLRTETRGNLTPAALVATLRKASDLSASARYSDIGSKLSAGKRVRIDSFAPAQFDMLRAHFCLPGHDIAFPEAIASARATLSRELNLVEAFVSLAGVPVAWDGAIASDDFQAIADRARTPMALLQLAGVARRDGPAAESLGLCERAIDAFEIYGELFGALLRWTRQYALRDPAWRVAPPANTLALLWAHADRMLDLAIGGRLESAPLIATLRDYRPEVAGIDLLDTVLTAAPDVADPAWISPAALVHHGFGMIFGEEDAGTALGSELMTRIRSLTAAPSSDGAGPEPKLCLRRATWPNAMNSFLSARPAGLPFGSAECSAIREDAAVAALEAIDADAGNIDSWMQLGGFGGMGLAAEHLERLRGLVMSDPAAFVRLAATSGQFSLWRFIAAPIAANSWREAADLVTAFAAGCHDLVARSAVAGFDENAATEELIETAAIIATNAADQRETVFIDMIVEFAKRWPKRRRQLHNAVSNILARTPSSRAQTFWRGLNRLGSISDNS